MWIERLDIEGFRRISGEFGFAKTLTIVVGDNEAGKSSLHEALVRGLFGFSDSERRRSRGSSLQERRAPWDGRPYRLVLSFRDDEDQSWRAEWDFAAYRARLLDTLGNDVFEGIVPGERFLEVGLHDFREVCCIDQRDLDAVRRSPSLGVALEEAVVQVTGDMPVEHAVERLNEFLRSVGARVDNLRPSPAGRLAALIRDREQLAAELRTAEEAREQLVVVARNLALASDEHAELARTRETTQQAALLAELRAVEQRLEEARRLERQAASRPAEPRVVTDEVREEIAAARDRLRAIREQVSEVEKEANRVSADVVGLETKQRELLAEVDALAPYADVDDSVRDEVQAAWAQLDTLATEQPHVASDVPECDPMLEHYRQERDDLHALESPQAPNRAKRVLWIALVVLTLGIAWLVRALVRRAWPSRSTPLADRLRLYGVASLAELDTLVAGEDRRVADAEAVARAFRQQHEENQRKRDELRSKLEAALEAAGAPLAEDLEPRVRAYLTAAARHGERRDREADLERVRRELEQAKRPVRDRDRLCEERTAAEARLRDAYAELGIEADDLDSAEVDFQRLLAEAAVDRRREEEAERSLTALRSLLADETLESLGRRVEEARRVYEDHRTRHGELTQDVGGAEGSSERLGSIDTDLQAQIDRVASLRTQAETLEEAAGDPAVLKERIAVLEAQIERIDEAKEAVSIARESLGEAADELKREFAPHLNEALRRDLERITGGRYSKAVVDGNLAVQVVVPETGQLKPADELSRATKDQLFLVERLEIARLLAPTKGSSPLLLDDPFAHYDRRRLEQAIELIGEAAQERQIIVFSEDATLAAVARQVCASCAVIELEAPPVRG